MGQAEGAEHPVGGFQGADAGAGAAVAVDQAEHHLQSVRAVIVIRPREVTQLVEQDRLLFTKPDDTVFDVRLQF